MNSFQFWPAPAHDLREVRRVLKDGGGLVLGLRIKNPARRFMGKVGFTESEIGEVVDLVRAAGFRDMRGVVRHLSRKEPLPMSSRHARAEGGLDRAEAVDFRHCAD